MHILIIYDDLGMSEMLKNTLTMEHHVVDVCNDAKEGLQRMLMDARDLVILNWNLHISEGNNLIRLIRSRGIPQGKRRSVLHCTYNPGSLSEQGLRSMRGRCNPQIEDVEGSEADWQLCGCELDFEWIGHLSAALHLVEIGLPP